MESYEKLGVFYLGRTRDAATRQTTATPLLYDARDLTTHAVCVGMTGSGKTGLCLGLLEEAAIDGIPAIIVDPKGDLGNLLLTFPDLRAEDFQPWVDPDDAARKGLTPEALAAETATKWRQGLASWDQDGDRIRRLKGAAEFAIYTPGSDAGRPVSVLASFAAPPAEVLADGDLYRDRIATAATSLLGLVGISADPLRSREHILLSTLFDTAWRAGRDIDIAGLIRDVQKPPIAQVGVLDLETFYPAGERFQLALALNNVIAAPSFSSWLQGAPLAIDQLLYTEAGKPRHAIFSIAHLSDAERMFFVSLLLNQTLGWMRTRPGSTSLRALFYMDEIFGFLPPVAAPPSKKPMLTLLKQARAFGLGVVLATQNPVDLDYKALANIGTWFLGRLQTDQDRSRVLEGLFGGQAAEPGSPRSVVEQGLSQVGSRVFLMHNVHDEAPTLFESRWVMSYLAGPMSREQIKRIEGARPQQAVTASPTQTGAAEGDRTPAVGQATTRRASARPVVPADVPEVFLAARSAVDEITYVPYLLGQVRVSFRHAKLADAVRRESTLLADLPDGAAAVDWLNAERLGDGMPDLLPAPRDGATFGDVPSGALKAASLKRWATTLQDTLAREERLDLWSHKPSGTLSSPGESERDFRIRLLDALRSERDRQVDALRRKMAPKASALAERIARAQQAVEREAAQASSQKMQAAISVGATLLSGLFGRKALSSSTLSKASSAARGFSRSQKESQDVENARENLARLEQQRAELEAEVSAEVAAIGQANDLSAVTLETVAVRAKKADVEVLRVALAWAPSSPGPVGAPSPAWR